MYVTYETIITAGSVLGALAAFGALAWKVFKWVDHQKEQDIEIAAIKAAHERDIKELRAKHDNDMRGSKANSDAAVKAIQEEQTLVVYGLLACLKGLSEQGCDGPVAEAIDKIDKHLNKRAHSQT